MKSVRVVLDRDLVKAVDELAARLEVSRSGVVTFALAAYVRDLRTGRGEDADRAGYARHPEDLPESAAWDRIAAWPEE